MSESETPIEHGQPVLSGDEQIVAVEEAEEVQNSQQSNDKSRGESDIEDDLNATPPVKVAKRKAEPPSTDSRKKKRKQKRLGLEEEANRSDDDAESDEDEDEDESDEDNYEADGFVVFDHEEKASKSGSESESDSDDEDGKRGRPPRAQLSRLQKKDKLRLDAEDELLVKEAQEREQERETM
ncbi:hypothetical protein EON64_17945, partial [archaeon]